MSCTSVQYKGKRFKGVENFLRRVAFNLGNTPSQTEVKIISCIPIDVTDLQQKILSLEKELEAVKSPCPQDLIQSDRQLNQRSVIQTALSRGAYSRHSSACHHAETCPALIGRSEADTSRGPPEVSYPPSCAPYPPPCGPPPTKPATPKKSQPPTTCMCWSSEASNADPCCYQSDNRKGIFKKQKKKKEPKPKKKDKCKTQLVYYAQTTNGPFEHYLSERGGNETGARVGEAMSRAYVSEMIRKQYMPVPMGQDYSVGSEFSSPVCKDVDQGYVRASPLDSDVCSCCHGPFHNIDQHMPRHGHARAPDALPTCSFNRHINNHEFYDTSLYDMVPVREKPKAVLKSYYGNPRRKSPTNNVNAQHYPERKRSRTRYHPYVVNHHSMTPPMVNHSRRAPVRIHEKKEKPHKVFPRRETVVERLRPTETSDSCCVDCGNVYIKRVLANTNPKETAKPPPVPVNVTSHKNAECLTQILNDTECQTTTTQSVQIDQELLEEKKTEETLNQIKTILQTVLTEVKTNKQLKKKVSEDKPTKDAVVQKGPSQGNMPGCSTLLSSFTYSPYNMNPYLPSCSRQMTSGPCYPNMPFGSSKCVHNYPVFIQTPPRHMCASCFRNSSHVPKMGQTRQATTTATNTEPKERSKETEKLIKEIYKSITVNMDFPTKDNSASENNDVKSTSRCSHNRSLYRASVLDDGMRKFVTANASRNVGKTPTPLSSQDEKRISNTMSTRSQIVSTTDTERRLRNHRLENYLKAVEVQKKQNRIVEEREYEEETPETTASDEEASSSDNERGAYKSPAQPVKKTATVQKTLPVKTSLFSKMIKSVKLFSTKNKRKEEQIQVDNELDEESENSDDYQTVYSQRVDRKPRYIPYPVRAVRSPARLKAHSKISYSRHMRDRNQERSRRSPYMEQEYRRQWNERFHERMHRQSSEEPYSGDSRRRPVYWQNYEARSALIRHPRNGRSVSPQADTQRVKRSVSPRTDSALRSANTASKGLAWLKKHKLGIHCGPQWKKLILEG